MDDCSIKCKICQSWFIPGGSEATNICAGCYKREAKAIASHAENLACATAWGISALSGGSFIAKQMAEVLKDYNNRNI